MTDAQFLGMSPTDIVIEDVDWLHRGQYIQGRSARHPGERDVMPEWATEAVFDSERLLLAPDPASESGKSIRVIGASRAANRVYVVILTPKDELTVATTGSWWGVNAWEANGRDRRRYNTL